MGRARKRLLGNAGGAVEKPNAPVDIQMQEAKMEKVKPGVLTIDSEEGGVKDGEVCLSTFNGCFILTV